MLILIVPVILIALAYRVPIKAWIVKQIAKFEDAANKDKEP